MFDTDVIVIGGGLAGLVSSIHLSKAGYQVLVFEKDEYPHHKVCGEYISNEVLLYLKWLNINPDVLKPTNLTKLEMSTICGKLVHAELPLGGFGISRFTFDDFLQQEAKSCGVNIIKETVMGIDYLEPIFSVTTKKKVYKSRVVIGAYGKRATLDHKLQRSFIQQKSGWLAVKAHYKGDFDAHLVALHYFKGGYCGISKVENHLINICYLVDYDSFKPYRNIKEHQEKVLFKNPHLKKIFQNSTIEFETPLSISQISFAPKECVKNHILMAGDTAGMIHPLCGNGMGMAIHAAKICSTLVVHFLKGKIASQEELERLYTKEWQLNFKWRLKMGRLLSKILKKEKLSHILINSLARFPYVLKKIIEQTHGKPITIEE